MSTTTAPQVIHSSIPLPPKLNTKGNLATNWRQWRQIWDSYEIVSHLKQNTDEYRVATFITCVGQDALDVFNGLAFENDQQRSDLNVILTLMEKHFIGETNVIYERYVFNNQNQESNESVDAFVTTLRSLIKSCNYDQLRDELIRDRIVCGIGSNTMRKRLLQESSLTLTKCLDICRAIESTDAKLKAMSTDEVHAFSQSAEKRRSFKKKAMPKRSTEKEQLAYDCKFCGYKHERLREKCPAWGKECKLCKSLNHFASKCRQKSRHTQQHRVHLLDKDTDSENEIMVVNNSSTKSKIFATAITESVKVLSLYNKSIMTSLGSSELCVTNPKNGASYNMTFVVIDAEVTPIIGSQSAQEMNLLKIQYQNILKIDNDNKTLTKSSMGESYADVFSGEGKMEGTLHLEVDETVSPVILPPRRVPVAMKQPLKDELTRLQEMGVIAEVDTPTDWVSSMVIVKKKSGKIRLCIDPKPLNKALKRSHYMLPVIEDIIPELTSAKVFTVCDVKNGFWHVELDQQSSYLTTFQTPYGRYRYCRMPFGISPAPEYFQQRLHQALEKIPGVFIIADDILVAGCGETAAEAEKDHDMKMTQLLERCREKNIKLNKEKLLWKRSKVSYMGHLITATSRSSKGGGHTKNASTT